jgi:predicted ribosome-associated RNA-binding protein Tma20
MQIEEIRKTVKARPFKAFEIHLENGEKYLINHPESIFITPHLIITVDEQEQTIFIAPEAVSTICFVNSAK